MNTKNIRDFKKSINMRNLQMLTCYDFQTAQIFNETEIDLLLVGDSLGNVVLGYDSTIPVGLTEMIIFTKAVKRGAPDKFVVADLPFGTYSTITQGIQLATKLYKETSADAIKLEGAFPYQLKLIERLTQTGIPVMGHIGLKPQSVGQAGGYFIYGKTQEEKEKLVAEALELEQAGCFSLVLECVEASAASNITELLSIPTIGIGSGKSVDGQVLVINDLLRLGKNKIPKFCEPVANLFETKKNLIQKYLQDNHA
ncbi:MAG: 3-methyl-2-oxobutanoate hydroxymethyltransferase [Bacteriovoracaceae bacterium]